MNKFLNFRLTFSKKDLILKLSMHLKYTAVIIFSVVIAALLGYAAGNAKLLSQSPLPQLAQNISMQETKISPLFESQTATITGMVTALNGNTITITDQKNQSDQFAVSNRMLIFKLSLTGPSSSPSADLKSVELNKPAVFSLEKNGQNYEVISIRYLPITSP